MIPSHRKFFLAVTGERRALADHFIHPCCPTVRKARGRLMRICNFSLHNASAYTGKSLRIMPNPQASRDRLRSLFAASPRLNWSRENRDANCAAVDAVGSSSRLSHFAGATPTAFAARAPLSRVGH